MWERGKPNSAVERTSIYQACQVHRPSLLVLNVLATISCTVASVVFVVWAKHYFKRFTLRSKGRDVCYIRWPFQHILHHYLRATISILGDEAHRSGRLDHSTMALGVFSILVGNSLVFVLDF